MELLLTNSGSPQALGILERRHLLVRDVYLRMRMGEDEEFAISNSKFSID